MKNKLTLFGAAILLAACGCVSGDSLELDAKNPAVTVKTTGVYFGERRVNPHEVPEILDDAGVSRKDTIHILLDPKVRDLKEARTTMGLLAKAGYTRSVLVTRRHAESEKIDEAEKQRRLRIQMERQIKQTNKKARYR